MIRATLVYGFIALYVIVMAPIGLLWGLAFKDTTLIYNLARYCIRMAGWMCRVRLRVRGKEKIQPGQHYVFLSNHQGNFDGPVLFYVIPRDVRALIKQEMMQIPLLSAVMKLVRFVPINRSDPIQARMGIDYGASLLRQGFSFFAFPEGTRSRDGRLGPFKKGVFRMAIQAAVPIVPITIVNSRKVQPPGTYGVRPGTIDVIFHDPIPTDQMDLDDRDKVIELTRAAIASALP